MNTLKFKPNYLIAGIFLLFLLFGVIFSVLFLNIEIGYKILIGYFLLLIYSIIILRIIYLTNPYDKGGFLYTIVYIIIKLIQDLWFFPPLFGKLFRRELNKILGAKIGKNSMIFGEIIDPYLVKIGDNTVVGHDCILSSHSIEMGKIFFGEITIGNNVTIGGKSLIFPNTIVEDNVVICAGAIMRKNIIIKKGEIWGGVPAKFIGNVENLKN